MHLAVVCGKLDQTLFIYSKVIYTPAMRQTADWLHMLTYKPVILNILSS